MNQELVFLLNTTIQNSLLYIPRLAFALILLFAGFKLQPFFDTWLDTFFKTHDYDPSLERFLQSFLGVAYKIGIILIAVSIAGIETASIIAALGAAGFAVGLALQGSMSNFASGILILSLKPIKVGDFIEVNGYTGTVHKIEIFSTVLLTIDNKTIIVPNSEITSTVLTNYSKQNLRRVDIKIGVAYNSDIKKVKQLLLKTIQKQTELSIDTETHPTQIRVDELADSAIILSLMVWCESKDYIQLKSTLLEEVKNTLDRANINIPYPTLSIQKS